MRGATARVFEPYNRLYCLTTFLKPECARLFTHSDVEKCGRDLQSKELTNVVRFTFHLNGSFFVLAVLIQNVRYVLYYH